MNYTAKTLDDALQAAAEDLECALEDLDYTILEQKAGLLGIGASITIDAMKRIEEAEEEAAEEITEEVPVEEEPSEEEEKKDDFDMEDVKEFLFDYLGSFFVGIDQDLECAIEEKDGGFIVNLNAENNAVLIGKQGSTLAAFNTVVKGAVNAKFHKHIDVLVDVNRYKEDRYKKISGMAKRIAKQVQRSHVDAELDPMPNDERKVIHKTLNNWHNIRTESEGDGRDRHVCIRYTEDEAPAEAE